MAVVDVINIEGQKVSDTELSDDIFKVTVKVNVLHDVVKMQLARKRSGTASTKHRGDVKGSTRKLYRQKGTGRARRGDIKSPLLRGGGVVFGPDSRSYDIKMPKKVRRLALKMALSSKFKENRITVLDRFDMDRISTKEFVKVIRALEKKNALFIIDGKNENLELSARNVSNVKVLRCDGLNVYDILKYDDLILLESSIRPSGGDVSDDSARTTIEGRLLS